MSDDLFTSGEPEPDATAFALPEDDAILARFDQPAEPDAAAATASDGPPRGPDGRFVARDAAPDQAPTADPSIATGVDDQADDASVDGVLAQFGIDPANLDDASLKLAQSYAELRKLDGRKSTELGELRARVAEEQAEPPVDQSGFDGEAMQAWLAQNPDKIMGVIGQAVRDDNSPLLAHGLVALEAIDPVSAEAIRIELAQANPRPAPAPVDPYAESRAGVKIQTAAATDPGLAAFLDSPDIVELAQEFPAIGSLLVSPDPEQKVDAILGLREVQRGRQHHQMVMTQQEVARATALEAQRVREEAFVASTTMSASGVKPSRADEIAAEWDARRAPYDDGWNL